MSVLVFVSQVMLAQVTYVQSDSVDKVALKWFNVYREYNKLPKVSMDLSRQVDAKRMTMKYSDSASKPNFIFQHTTDRKCKGEVAIPAGGVSVKMNDSLNDFTKFVKTVFNRKLSDLTTLDIMVMKALFTWENSPKHKDIITKKDNVKCYFSLSFPSNQYLGKPKFSSKVLPKYQTVNLRFLSVIQFGY